MWFKGISTVCITIGLFEAMSRRKMVDSMISHVCPEEIRAKNHKAGNIKVWNDPEYQADEAEFLRENPECHYCGRPSEVVHHDNPDSYRSEEEYRNLRQNGTPACHACHAMYRRGFVICPVCHAHYIRPTSECCRYCVPAVEIERRNQEREKRKATQEVQARKLHNDWLRRHPRTWHSCYWHGSGQRCNNPLRRDKICSYSSRDAADRCDPDHFTARKGAKQ